MDSSSRFPSIIPIIFTSHHLPDSTKATRPTLSALSEMSAKMVNTMGRITADLNFKASKIGTKSFLSFPRASASRKLHKFQAKISVISLLLLFQDEKLFMLRLMTPYKRANKAEAQEILQESDLASFFFLVHEIKSKKEEWNVR